MALFGSKKTGEDKKKSDKDLKKSIPNNNKKSKTDSKDELGQSMQELYNTPEIKAKTESTSQDIKKVSQTNSKSSRRIMAYKVLVKPVITEKATNLVADNKYAFVVNRDANKISVAQAIKDVYGVKVEKVNIMNYSGKRVVRGKIKGRRSDWKKAIITLKKGDSIKIYEGV